ncbi:MAG: LamG-like jellyroll fold domain-containing protein [Saprospiraceae bacterium]
MNQTYSINKLRSIISLLAVFLTANALIAQTVWTGAADADFFNAANWSTGLPAAGNDAVIPGGTTVEIASALSIDYRLESFGDLTLSAVVTIVDGAMLQSSGSIVSSARINAAGEFMNFGTLELTTTGSLYTTPTGVSRTNGSILNDGWIGSQGSFTNEGTVNVTAEGGLAIYNAGTFNNPGVVNLAGFYNNRNGGSYTAPSGGTINVQDGGKLNNYAQATMQNAGILNVEAGGSFRQKANLNNVPGRMFVSGELRTFVSSVTRSNFLTIEEGGQLLVNDSDTFQVVFSLVNEGLVSLYRPVTVNGIVTNTATGNFKVRSTGALDFIQGTNLTNAGNFENAGSIKTVGTLTNDGTFSNTGQILQNNGGTIANNADFFNQALLENVDKVINNGRFINEGRLTNNSGGTIENNADFTNAVNAHIQNLFEIYNKSKLVNRGFFENGVSLFNEADFENFGFLSNVGDIFNTPSGRFFNKVSGVIDNSGSGIFTNEGYIYNAGEINNFSCGIFVNNNLIDNPSWITNEGIFYQNGTITDKAIMGNGPVVAQGGSSPLICQPWTQKLDQNGNTIVSGTRFAAARFDSCDALQYLFDGVESKSYTCSDLGTHQVIFTLVDRRGNEINCGTQLTITDEYAPRIDSCPAEIQLLDQVSAPVAATWDIPTFVDNCDTDLDIVASHQPGDQFPEGTTVVSYTATDDAGNVFLCEFNVVITVKVPGCAPKNSDGLLAYYNLKTPLVRWVYDRSGYGEPLHMENKNTSDITREGDCGFTSNGHGIIRSGSASKVANGIMMTNAMTLEAWVKPANKTEDGPARIVTISENTGARNFTLGQEDGRFVFRLKTTQTNGNGMPNRLAGSTSVKPGQEQHLVFTRDAAGNERFYVDGDLQYSAQVGGNLSNWGAHCSLGFFNEMTNDRGWKGSLMKVAIYDRAWGEPEVLANQLLGACCADGDDSPQGDICEGQRGQVSYERYENIAGVDLPWLYKEAKFPASPDATQKLTKLQIPNRVGDNYGSRTRGWIYPETSGDYQFAISGDDHTRLLLSRFEGDASYAYTIASISGWTNDGQLDKYNSQKSASFHLSAGKAYYFELLHKENGGGDHASVYWKRPGSRNFALIGADNIGDIESCGNGEGTTPNNCASAKGGLLREVWTGINSNDIWALMSDPRYPNNPDSRGLIQAYCGPLNAGDGYGTRVRGYIHPDVTGDYTFTVTGDNQTKLLLSTDDTEANAAVIAGLNGWTNTHQYDKYPSQRSATIRLEAGKRYYTELLHQEGVGGDFFNVFWQTPTNNSRAIVPGSNLSPYVDCDSGVQPEVCNTDILLVVGSTTLNNGDAAAKHRLIELGYNLMIKDAQWANAAMAEGKGLVIISSTVNSGHIGSKFRDVTVPVMTWESYLYDDMRMTMTSAGRDYGNSHSKSLDIVSGTDQLAAGGNGHENVYHTSGSVRYGKVMDSEARIIANAPADPWMASIFAYDAGDQMAGGMRAPAKRIGFYLDNNGAACWTQYGRSLFDAAVRYATNCTGNETARRSADVLTLAAEQRVTNVKLDWVSNTAFKNDYFLVERSNDDINYFVIDEVPATGFGDSPQTMTYVDASPLEGENFYRITAVYTDGDDRSSELRLVNFASLGDVSVYPNPASTDVNISLSGFEGREVTLRVSDPLGRILSTSTLNGSDEIITLDVSDYAAGWYSISLQSGDYVKSEMLMITGK